MTPDQQLEQHALNVERIPRDAIIDLGRELAAAQELGHVDFLAGSRQIRAAARVGALGLRPRKVRANRAAQSQRLSRGHSASVAVSLEIGPKVTEIADAIDERRHALGELHGYDAVRH